jgi:hypothetical protein
MKSLDVETDRRTDTDATEMRQTLYLLKRDESYKVKWSRYRYMLKQQNEYELSMKTRVI